MIHCGINGWDVLMERREEPDRRYLDNHLKGTSQSQKKDAICYRWLTLLTTPKHKEVLNGTVYWIRSSFKKYLQGSSSALDFDPTKKIISFFGM